LSGSARRHCFPSPAINPVAELQLTAITNRRSHRHQIPESLSESRKLPTRFAEDPVFGLSQNDAIYGSLAVFGAGLLSASTVYSGGQVTISSGGTGSSITVVGTEIVEAGGTELGVGISGGEQDVYGVATDAMIFAGSQVVESGGTATGTILSGGTLNVQSGGTAYIAPGSGEITDDGGTIGAGVGSETYHIVNLGNNTVDGAGTSNVLDYSEASGGIVIATIGTVVGLPGTRDTFSDIQIFDGSPDGKPHSSLAPAADSRSPARPTTTRSTLPTQLARSRSTPRPRSEQRRTGPASATFSRTFRISLGRRPATPHSLRRPLAVYHLPGKPTTTRSTLARHLRA
jgi:autotransporter passenger strand-loop-strand repeat protein